MRALILVLLPCMLLALPARHPDTGRIVTIAGRAENAKISAIVISKQLSVYCLNHSQWKPEQTGKPVRVKGRLEYTEEFNAKTENGEISQGTAAGVYVIRRCEILPQR